MITLEEKIKKNEEELCKSIQAYNNLITTLVLRVQPMKLSIDVEDIHIEDIKEKEMWNPFDHKENNQKVKAALEKIHETLTLKYEHEVDLMRLRREQNF